MAGNVREWIENAAGDNAYFILGGAWKSQSYLYLDPEALAPLNRSPTNGFRCVRNTTPLPQELTRSIKAMERDFSKVKPAYSTQRFKDLGRSVDYLETRPDIDKDKLAYLGVNMGSAEGVIYTALIQDKLKAIVFLDGGFFLGRAPTGGDQADFAPRLKKPILMVNGRYDYTFSLEKSPMPLFQNARLTHGRHAARRA